MRSRTLGDITRGDRDGLKSLITSSKSMDDLSQPPLPRPLRTKFPSVTDLIVFYDSCDGDDGEDDEGDEDGSARRRIKSSSVSELHNLGGVSFPAKYLDTA